MPDLKSFRRVNNLTQSDVARFLGGGVEKGFISQIEHGTRKLPDAQLAKLLSNDLGWDTTMLLDNGHAPSISTHATGHSNASVSINSHNTFDVSKEKDFEIAALKKEIEFLNEKLRDRDEQIAFLKSLITK